ncbi:MAG: hypothetical protein WA816_12800 [Bacteroidales bacterium]
MKGILTSFMAFVFCLMGIAQEPDSFVYQTIIHSVTGEILASRVVSLKISILIGNPFDTVVYSESHKNITTNQSGLVSLAIGKGTEKNGNLAAIDWNADKYFLKVELDTKEENTYTEIGASQILVVPFVMPKKSADKTSGFVTEDNLFISRKFVGTFMDYRQTGPATFNGPNIIWIKTSMDNTYGKISAYGKRCDFSVGDKLYLRRTYYSPGVVSGYWVYQIENDSSIYYRVTDFQHDKKVLVETWF